MRGRSTLSSDRPGRPQLSRWGVGIGAVLVLGSAIWSISPPAPAAPVTFALQIVSPATSGVSTDNQLEGKRPSDLAITDADAEVHHGRHTISGIAKGMKNVAVIVPVGGAWTMAEPAASGAFTAEVTIPDVQGPLPIEVIAWNSPPNDPHYTVELKARVNLFVTDGQSASLPTTPPPGHPAAGMSLVWSDDFTEPLSFSSAQTRNATWFSGGKPSVTGSQYSDAVFVAASDPRNPYLQKDGFLRIRATNDPTAHDPTGWKRRWWSGHLSTGFPDGTASAEFREGYAEVRMMVPAGAGAWPAFWLLDSASTPTRTGYGAVEVDVMEGYGHDRTAYMATMHRWPGSNPREAHVSTEAHVSIPENPDGFHTYGVRLTRTEVIWYLDRKEVKRAPLYRADIVSPFFLMINLSMGGGWPIIAPPAGHYDLWVDYVALYQ